MQPSDNGEEREVAQEFPIKGLAAQASGLFVRPVFQTSSPCHSGLRSDRVVQSLRLLHREKVKGIFCGTHRNSTFSEINSRELLNRVSVQRNIPQRMPQDSNWSARFLLSV